jgi:hypothetical protein
MSWNCRCELCRRAYRQTLQPRRWTDFLRHRDDAVIRADSNDGVPVYLTELDNEIVVATETMNEPKTLRELETEEVLLVEFLEGCNVEPIEENIYRTPFEQVTESRNVISVR